MRHTALLPQGFGSSFKVKLAQQFKVGESVWDELCARGLIFLESERYNMHDIVRRGICESLSQEQRTCFEDTVGSIMGALAREWGKKSRPGAEQPVALDWLECEWGNLRACLQRGFGSAQTFPERDFTDFLEDFVLMRGRLNDCEAMLRDSLSIRQHFGPESHARALLNLADTLEFAGQATEAVALSHRANQLLQTERSVEARRLVAFGHRISGRALLANKDYRNALKHHQASERVYGAAYEDSGDPSLLEGWIRAINYQGRVYEEENKWSKAREHYQKALELCQKHHILIGEGRILTNIGIVLLSQSWLQEAENCFRQAEEISREQKDERSLLRLEVQWARLESQNGNYAPARERASNAITWATKIQERKLFDEAQEILNQIERLETATASSPVLRRVSLPEIEFFEGRDDVVQQVKSLLESHNAVLIWGDRGMGKSSLATEIAKSSDRRYRYFIECEKSPSYAGVLRQLWRNMTDVSIDLGAAILEEKIREKVQQEACFVVIDGLFDDFDGQESEVLAGAKQLYQLFSDSCSQLLVTRCRDWRAWKGKRLHLLPPSLSQCVEVFQASRPGWTPTESELKATQELCRRAERLPLAIGLLSGSGLSVETLIGQFDQILFNSKKEKHASVHASAKEKHASLLACYQISFEQLSEAERDFYVTLSLLSEGPTTEMMQVITDTQPENSEVWATTLAERGLWRRENGRYRVHSLVRHAAGRLHCAELREFIVDFLDQVQTEPVEQRRNLVAEKEETIGRFVRLWFNMRRSVESDFDDGGAFIEDDFMIGDIVAPFIFSLDPWDTYRQFFDALYKVADGVGHVLWASKSLAARAEIAFYDNTTTKDFALCRQLIEQLIALEGDDNVPAQVKLASALAFGYRTLALSYRIEKNPEQALVSQRKCVAQWEICFNQALQEGTYPSWEVLVGWIRAVSQTALLTNVLGQSLGTSEQVKHAEDALDIYEQILHRCREGKLLIAQSRILNNIGFILIQQGRHSEAIEKLQEALEISRKEVVGDTYCEGRILLKLVELGYYNDDESKAILKTTSDIFLSGSDKPLYEKCQYLLNKSYSSRSSH